MDQDRLSRLREDLRALLDDLESESVRISREMCLGHPSDGDLLGKVRSVIDAGSTVESVTDKYGTDADLESIRSVLDAMRGVERSMEGVVPIEASSESIDLIRRAEDIVRVVSSIEGAAIAPIGKWIKD